LIEDVLIVDYCYLIFVDKYMLRNYSC